MKLRNAHLAIVPRFKIVDYLLNSSHPDNGGKAQFFESLSFSIDKPELLIAALRAVAQSGEVVDSTASSHGEKHVVDGSLSSQTETRHTRMVRTVWIIDQGLDAPRLVTAYPGKEWDVVMITEHDRVVLTAPVPAERLEIGDVGTVVHVYMDGKAFEVEFTALDGHTAAVATVEASQVRPVTGREITHARQLAARWRVHPR